MREVNRLLKIKPLHTSIYHPQSNGLCEKYNADLKRMLVRLCIEQPRQWHRFIALFLFAYREVPQESTEFAPFELLYRKTIRGPMQIVKELWTKEVTENEIRNSYAYVLELRERIEKTLKLANENLGKAQARYKSYYDRRAKERKFKIKDLVLVLLPTSHNKLLMTWIGPCRIVTEKGGNNYGVEIKGKVKTLHANLLKKYIQREEMVEETRNETASLIIMEEQEEDEGGEQILMKECESKEGIEDIKIEEKLLSHQKKDIKEIFIKYKEIFTELPGMAKGIKHKINLTSEDPVKTKPYPIPYNAKKELKEEVDKMLKLKVIRRSNSAYASPIVTVKKKDGSMRVCADYRKLNKITLFDPEPMTTAEDLFTKMGTSKYFSKLDLSKGYWQVPMADEDIPKTAFVTQDGHFEFLRMPFGLVNSNATLVKVLREILHDMKNTESYMDDIIIFTRGWNEHLDEIEKLCSRLKEAGFTVRPSKCEFGMRGMEFLGHT